MHVRLMLRIVANTHTDQVLTCVFMDCVALVQDESHAGKVVERHWYEKNKHIFPASRWEVFEFGKNYGNYTIGSFKMER